MRFLLTGITGQAGTEFCKKLLPEHEVIGMYRRTANTSFARMTEAGLFCHSSLSMVSGDITDYSSIDRIIKEYKPDVIGNLAAASHVGDSFKEPLANIQITGVGCANMLEAIRNNYSDTYRPKFWQMSSSEMFGSNYSCKTQTGRIYHTNTDLFGCKPDNESFQYEDTPLSANSPYAAAKIYAHNMTELYRKAYGIYANSMICFNFEGPFRGETFVTRKVTRYVAEFKSKNGKIPKLRLGNLDSQRSWLSASDMVDAVLLALQHPSDTYVVSHPQVNSIRDLCRTAFSHIGVDNWQDFVEIDPQFIRPVEVPYLRGDSSKISKLGWKPKVAFEQLIKEMVDADIYRI
jgi:GDPmannose 4,6-dehydratase